VISTHDMRISLCRLLIAGGCAMVFALSSGCASNQGTLQSRIENKIDNPDTTSNVTPTTEHYNSFAQDFEPAWPFGPYSHQ
jgi:hypothetical protein